MPTISGTKSSWSEPCSAAGRPFICIGVAARRRFSAPKSSSTWLEQVEAAVAAVRAAGVAAINIDLMYGLPRQTVGDVIRSAELAASLAASRIALFGYAHVPWFKPHQKLIDTQALPGAAERMAQMYAAAETLEECGYVQVGLDHFALVHDACCAPHAPVACIAISRAIPPTRATP